MIVKTRFMRRFAGIVAGSALLTAALMTGQARAAHLEVYSLASGYTSSSIEIGMYFGGALAVDPVQQSRVIVSASLAPYGSQYLVAVNTANGTTSTLAGPVGNIGGIAVLANGDIVFTENQTSDSIFRARDINADGDCADAGEVTQLIAPILADSPSGFTGGQIVVAPSGNVSQIPAGALIIQTADGGTSGELLVVQNPTTAPSYVPASGAYYAGFPYNGGVVFDQAGHVIVGEAGFYTGRVVALVNTNGNSTIDAGESNTILPASALTEGIADMAISKEDRVFFGANSTELKSFVLPPNLLTQTTASEWFATTNAAYTSALRFDSTSKSFSSSAGTSGAKLYVSGLLAPYWDPATNIVSIQPSPSSGVGDWQIY